MHNHSNHTPHTTEPKTTGSDMCLVENREMENFSQLDQTAIANHVWETCKPGGSFMCKAPTVSARRVQLMRVHLQSDSKEPEPDPLEEEAQREMSSSKLPARTSLCQCGASRTDTLSRIKSFLAPSTSYAANPDEQERGEEDYADDCEDDN